MGKGALTKIKKESEMRKGRPYDEHRCFYIKDFKQGDCIRLTSEDGERIRGVVTSVDFDNLHIIYKTSESDKHRTTIDKILTLESYVQGWLTDGS